MAMRSSWEGYLRLNLISVPVKAFSATTAGRGRIGFHLLHAKCNSRIRYKKVCPIHGEVRNDEIVSGYEHAKDQYVVIKKEELQKLRPETDKAIEIDVFVDPPELDPAYFTERVYYLTPDGRAAQKSYAVLQQVMADSGRYAIGTMVFSGREQIVAVRPTGRLLAVSFLRYADEVKSPSSFEDEVSKVEIPAKELELARGLIEASTAKKFDMQEYKDKYAGKVLKLIESKAGRRGSKRAPEAGAEEEPAIINLMDALKESLKQAQHTGKRRVKSKSNGRRHVRGKAG